MLHRSRVRAGRFAVFAGVIAGVLGSWRAAPAQPPCQTSTGVAWESASANAQLCAVQTWVATLPEPMQTAPNYWIWALQPGQTMMSACWHRAASKQVNCSTLSPAGWG